MNISKSLLIVGFVFITFIPFLSSCDRRPPEVKEIEVLQVKAESGDIEAQVSLASKYYKGQGVLEDHATAFRWYLKAAEQGDAYAQHQIGLFYTKGEVVEKDLVKAYAWFNLAAAGGHKKSAEIRSKILKEIRPNQITQAQKLSRKLQYKIDHPSEADAMIDEKSTDD